ncbi:MAG: Chitinase (EC [uncultured Thiotrichaceae bacterium]|uniref:Chitinase (EC) n=1 Tax=uncultured Thiotrichaceae bacterium TaxID=298394 RepID=A0A6S6TXT2_9GAMM|nr:MAG: Chitinase (EC [uncultured Thiotrichaceae bacterium]
MNSLKVLVRYSITVFAALIFLSACGEGTTPNTDTAQYQPEPQLQQIEKLGKALDTDPNSSRSDIAFRVPTNNTGGWGIDTTNRQQVRQFYNSVYLASLDTPIGWTGDVSTCSAGTTTSEFKDSVLSRVNYYRAMAGVPANITFDSTFSAKAQEAALIMSAEGGLNHFPPTTATCYTVDGAEAAASSNLSLGNNGWDAVGSQMRDNGASNDVAGHRRWILFPQTQEMGTGDIPDSENAGTSYRKTNSLWVFDGRGGDPRPTTREEFVAWPAKGYNPYQTVPVRWSFSYDNADFTNATISMTEDGSSITPVIETRNLNYGESAIVWLPDGMSADGSSARWPQPSADTNYDVTIDNVMINGVARSFNYTVTVFDPATALTEEVATVTGNATPDADAVSTYNFNSVTNADRYDAIFAEVAVATDVFDAEDNGVSVTDETDSAYDIIASGSGNNGGNAYRLAPGTLASSSSQSFELVGTFIPSATSVFEFDSQLAFATGGQTASIQISTDEGASWKNIFAQTGDGSRADSNYVSRSISLASYADTLVTFRANYSRNGGFYSGFGDSVSFLTDNFTITNAKKVSSQAIQDTGSTTSFDVTPEANKEYVVAARSVFWDGYPASDWGPLFRITPQTVVTPLQTVTPSQASFTISPGDIVAFDLLYPEGNPAASTGLGVTLYFDSSKLSFGSITDILSTNFLTADSSPVADTANGDNDTNTDSTITVAWTDFGSNWPNSALPLDLYTVSFTASAGFTSNTVINFTGNAAAGNDFASTPVTVNLLADNVNPTITAPADTTIEATGTTTSVSDAQLGTATAADNVDASPSVTHSATTALVLGTNTVVWTVTDSAGNTATANQVVTIADTTAPSITAPADVSAAPTGATTTVTLGTPAVSDLVDGSPSVVASPTGPFTIGTHTVTWTATDASGNTATATQQVVISADNVNPTITAPADTTIEATGTTTSVSDAQLGTATAADNVDASPSVTHSATTALVLGTNTVVWTVTDSAGNTATANQVVTIADTTAPSITAPADVTVPTTGATTAVTLGTPTLSDLVDSSPTATASPAGPFAVGIHTVTWTVSDASGNENTATQTVTVTDLNAVTILEVQVDSSSDDAEEYTSGQVKLSSSDLELSDAPESNAQTVGIRFNGINIPAGAVISDAYVQFTVDETNTETTSLTVYGEANANPVTFTTDNGDITSRALTTANASWNPASWDTVGEQSSEQQTEDISAIIQELVNQSGWNEGQSMAIIIVGEGSRTAESFDGDSADAPTLHIEYSTDGNPAPIANVIATPQTGNAPLTVDFDASGSTDNGTITRYDWDFGDNSNALNGGSTISHDYQTPGEFSVTLVVTDDEGKTDNVTIVITVIDPNIPSLTALEVQVNRSSDDAEEASNGSVNLTSSDLELTKESSTQTIGIRFTDINLPKGALISNAYIQFQVDEVASGATQLTVNGEASGNPATFSNGRNNITARPLTSASVDWSPEAWPNRNEQGVAQQTSDLSMIVQELVNQSSWDSGQAMAFIISGNGKRVAESFNGNAEGAPTLHIEYTTDGNPAPIASLVASPTTGNATLNVTFDGSGSTDNGSVVRYDWDFGDGSNELDSASVVTHSYSNPGTYTATLTVVDDENKTASTNQVITVIDPNQPTTLDIKVSNSSDDAEEFGNGTMYLDSSDLELTQDSSSQTVGMRFNEVTIPVGAIISRAYIQFQVDETSNILSGLGIHGEASANPTTFTSNTNDITSRPLTLAHTFWIPVAWEERGANGIDQRTADISAVVQELVSQSGWNSGQSMVFIINGDSKRVAESYDGTPEGAPTLHVEYSMDGNPAPIANIVANPETGTATLDVSFDGSTSTDDGSITQYDWDFGDGTALDTGAIVNHSYTVPGTYTVTLTVTDDGNKTAVTSVTITVIDPYAPTTLDIQVNSSADDAEEFSDGEMYLDSSDLEFIDSSESNNQMIGVRFNEVALPVGAIITNAYLQFKTDETDSEDTNLIIYGDSNVNPAAFTETNGDISDRILTAASSDWAPAPWSTIGEQDVDQRSSDISNIIQELVNQPGWNRGQSMAFIIKGAGKRVADSFDGNSEDAPILHIEYSVYESLNR